LKNAENSALVVTAGQDERCLSDFEAIHSEMCQRKTLANDGGLSAMARAYRAMKENQRPYVVLAYFDGKPVSGAMLSTVGRTGHYQYGETSNDGMKLKASNLVQWQSIMLLRELGMEAYDLVSINPKKNPGTYHFKLGLCGKNGIETSQVGPYWGAPTALHRMALRAGLWAREWIRR
jgi:hypothetical protein